MFRRKWRRDLAVKAITGLFFGIMIRSIYDKIYGVPAYVNINFKDCKACKRCPTCAPTSIEFPLDSDLRQKYIPKGMYEVTRWYYFDDKYLYDIINEEPKVPIIGQWDEEIKAITQVALEYLNSNQMFSKTWELVERENGYVQTDTLQGTEYIVDLKVMSTEEPRETSVFRVRLLHPFKSQNYNDLKLLSHFQDVQEKFHIIVPASGDKTSIEDFLNMFKSKVRNMPIDMCLTVATFSGAGRFLDSFDVSIITYVKDWIRENKDICVDINELIGDYDYLRAIKQVSQFIKEHTIVISLQDDMDFEMDFINSCQAIARQQKQVYFPLAFSLFDSYTIENGWPPGKAKIENRRDINKYNGYWMHRVHDFICAYAVDYQKILSNTILSENIIKENNYYETGEGGYLLYNTFLSADYKVISSVEPGLLRLYKSRNCSNFTNSAKRRKCEIIKKETAGSNEALAILYLTENAAKL